MDDRIVLGSDCSAVLIRTSGGRLTVEPWDANTLVSVTPDMAADGGVFVLTADQWGPFEIRTRSVEAAPPIEAAWEDVVEFSLRTPTGLEVSEVVDQYPSATLVERPGDYRIRVSARGRAFVHHSEEDDDLDQDDADESPVELFLIEAWLAPVSPPVVVKLDSEYAKARLAGPQNAPLIPEAAAGIAAAARIGRDVDMGLGARRALTGSTTTVTVERTWQGARRKMFWDFAYSMSLAHRWDFDSDAWDVYGDTSYEDYEIGSLDVRKSLDSVDQLTGSRDAIRAEFLEVQRPEYFARRWDWIRTANQDTVQYRNCPRVLPSETIVTTRFSEEKDDAGLPWTTVRIEHVGIPTEWADDMAAWWTFQLAIGEHAKFGR